MKTTSWWSRIVICPLLLTSLALICVLFFVACNGGGSSNNNEVADDPFETEDDSIEVQIDLSKSTLLELKASPERGFHWDYFLFVPEGVQDNINAYMLVEPNNTGTASDDIGIHHERALSLIERGTPRIIAEALNTPLLVPVFPRSRTRPEGAIYDFYSHALCRDSLLVTEERFRRVDLQLVAMIAHAQKVLRSNGIQVNDKVFMHGFSASGNYLTRFPMMHPEKVRAVAAGGLNGMPTLPVRYWKKWTFLRYPVGIADLYELTGIEFNMDEYKKISQFLYMGYLDKNDTLPFTDAYYPEDAALLREMLGDDIMDRWQESQAIFADAGINAQFVTYNGTHHQIRSEMRDDIIRFFQENAGNEIVHISPHQYEFVPFQKHEKLTIIEAAWHESERFPALVKPHTSDNDFVVFVKEFFEKQDYRQWNDFISNLPHDGKDIYLSAEGLPKVAARFSGRTFTLPADSDYGFVFTVEQEEMNKILRGMPYALAPVKADDTYFFTVSEGVRLTKNQ